VSEELRTMDLYGSLKTIHMVGAALLFIALGFEAIAARGLQRAGSADVARRASRTLRRAGRAGYIAAAAILIPGVWMMTLGWGPVAWTVTALIGIVIMAVASIRARGMLARFDTAFGPAAVDVRPEVRAWIVHSVASSLSLRASLAIGILVLMTTKPGWINSTAILAIAVVFGLAGALRSDRRAVQPLAQLTVPTRNASKPSSRRVSSTHETREE
jgi:hypothetical protein